MIVEHTAVNWFQLFKQAGLVKRRRGERRKKHERDIINLVCAFDIEASTVHIENTDPDKIHDEHSFMYVWQCQISDRYTIVGRYWSEFTAMMENIRDALAAYGDITLSEEPPLLIMYVHNLAYEFQFFAGIYHFEPKECFFRKERKPLYCRMYNAVQFRCSFAQTNMSLKKFAEQMGCLHQKQSGQQFDYSKIRYPWTPLTDTELEYCVDDVICLVQAITIEMQRDGDTLRTIPLTSTGYVRRDAKRACYPVSRWIKTLLPDIEQYKMLRRAFRGGNTHANRAYVNKIVENVESVDMTSCYPAQQLTKMFPVSPWRWISDDLSMTRITRLTKAGYAVIGDYLFTDIELKNNREPIPYLALSKTKSVGFQLDNGRLLAAQYCLTTLTELDLAIILKQYKFSSIKCSSAMVAKKGPLPDVYKNLIKGYYNKKTILKGCTNEDEIYQYNKSKALLNSIYGMSAQDPIHQQIDFIDGVYHVHDYDSEGAAHELEKALFPYQWGVYTTAYARAALQAGIDLAGDRIIYCDTDSVKTDGHIDFTALNFERKTSAVQNGAYANDQSGETHYCGVYEVDGIYKRFITQGAKRYAYEDKKGLHITVAGVTKTKNEKTGVPFAVQELGSIQNFREGMLWTLAGGTGAVYNDDDNIDLVIDGHDLHIGRNVSIVNTTYQLGYSNDYANLLKTLQLYGEWRKRYE